MSSPKIWPWITALSPITNPAECTSPSTRPSIWISPVEVSVPVTTRSALMIDGADERMGRLACWDVGCGAEDGAAACGVSLLLLENMAACLDKSARIPHHI